MIQMTKTTIHESTYMGSYICQNYGEHESFVMGIQYSYNHNTHTFAWSKNLMGEEIVEFSENVYDKTDGCRIR